MAEVSRIPAARMPESDNEIGSCLHLPIMSAAELDAYRCGLQEVRSDEVQDHTKMRAKAVPPPKPKFVGPPRRPRPPLYPPPERVYESYTGSSLPGRSCDRAAEDATKVGIGAGGEFSSSAGRQSVVTGTVPVASCHDNPQEAEPITKVGTEASEDG